MAKNGSDIKAGQYWAAKYRGDNGDLILGRVKSYRAGDDIVLINLLSPIGKKSIKTEANLRRRNKRITKKEADAILKVWKDSEKTEKDKAAVRELAVNAPEVGAKQLELDTDPAMRMRIRLESARPSYAHLCYAADQRRREEAGWTSLAWVGINWEKPRNNLEKQAIKYIKERFSNQYMVHVYDLVDLIVDLTKIPLPHAAIDLEKK